MKMRKVLIVLVLICTITLISAGYFMLPKEIPSKLKAESEVLQGLKVVLKINGSRFYVGETITVKLELINVSNEPITIYHGIPLFGVDVYDTAGDLVYRYPDVILVVVIIHTLQPGDRIERFVKFELEEEGNYKVLAYARFYLENPVKTRGKDEIRLYTATLPIEIVLAKAYTTWLES